MPPIYCHLTDLEAFHSIGFEVLLYNAYPKQISYFSRLFLQCPIIHELSPIIEQRPQDFIKRLRVLLHYFPHRPHSSRSRLKAMTVRKRR